MPGFVQSDDAILLDAVAKRYGQRPSALALIDDPYLAYCFDQAIALRGIEFEANVQNPQAQEQTTMNLGGITLSGNLSGYTEAYRKKMLEQGQELD